MIQINQEQVRQIEYLINQSMSGNHILFDVERIREVFSTRTGRADESTPVNPQAVEGHLEKMIALPTLAQKRAFLERLDNRTFRMIVRTYFNIVENNLYDLEEAKH
ncbi:MAG: hypothetical protein KA715_08035 [Xanthomonadaceae bacterium]|nr:hypothetical protein [Xanthomonadaceae bacterium]